VVAIEILSVLTVDVGSPKAGRLGWADRAAHGGASEFPEAVDRLASRLKIDGSAAVGFAAPIWAPRRARLKGITEPRQGIERKLGCPWTTGARASALATALGLMTWTFGRIVQAVPEAAATIDPAGWRERGGLLIWEAFVTSATMQKTRADDAMTVLKAFMARWPDLRSDIPVEAAVNLGVAAALSAGLCVDIDEIGAPSVVIAAVPEGVTVVQTSDQRSSGLRNRPIARGAPRPYHSAQR
jgi:hypothetical protein